MSRHRPHGSAGRAPAASREGRGGGGEDGTASLLRRETGEGPASSAPPRPEAGAPAGPPPPAIAAFFDVDGTLTKSDIFRDLVTFRRQSRKDLLFDLSLPVRGLALLALDQVSRVAVNRLTYSWYGGFRRDEFVAWAARFQSTAGRRRLLDAPLQALAHHARAGHRVVLLTGAVDLLVAPLPALLAEATGVEACRAMRVEAVPLEERDGVFTGRLAAEPLGEDAKARRARAIAAEEGLDLARSYAYGDSIADLPLLECVGRPAAVRPDWRLRRQALRRGWPVLEAPSLLPET